VLTQGRNGKAPPVHGQRAAAVAVGACGALRRAASAASITSAPPCALEPELVVGVAAAGGRRTPGADPGRLRLKVLQHALHLQIAFPVRGLRS
jgi:hypothetical protein